MARSGFPSMTALLGLLAVAGYQNRDRLSEMMRNAQGGGAGGLGGQGGGGLGGGQMRGQSGGMGSQMGGMGGLGSILGGLFGGGAGSLGGGAATGQGSGQGSGMGGGLGGLLGGGLGELDQHMRRQGRGEAMDSWVGTGPNARLEPHDLEASLGPDVLDDLEEQTGLSRSEILQRLSKELPEAVDQYTPEGRIPDRDAFDRDERGGSVG